MRVWIKDLKPGCRVIERNLDGTTRKTLTVTAAPVAKADTLFGRSYTVAVTDDATGIASTLEGNFKAELA